MKIFIAGISGLLGLNLALHAKDRHQLSGCYLNHPILLEGVSLARVDLTQSGDTIDAITTIRPDVVINTVALTDVDRCQKDPQLALSQNVDSAHNVALACKATGARLIHISTDQLFDGPQTWKTETHPLSPPNHYGKTKMRAEEVVTKVCPGALVIRTNFFGWGTSLRTSFSDWIIGAIRGQQTLTMFTDVFFTPILINDLADILDGLIETGATGVFHVAGADRLSKHDFASRLAKVFGLSDDNIRPISVEEFNFAAMRPKEMSLGSHKSEQWLQAEMPGVISGLTKLRDLEKTGWTGRLEQAITQEIRGTGASVNSGEIKD